MSIEFEGKILATTADGGLAEAKDWSHELAVHMARLEGLELGPRHWDVIAYLRDEFFNNEGNIPSIREIIRAMTGKWEGKVDEETLYELFPLGASTQGARIAGVTENRRKRG